MPTLHIVQGGIENGDKRWLERAARSHLRAKTWIAPKVAGAGDEAVIFVGGYGFFATARVTGQATPRRDWVRRYGAPLDSIRLIEPPISLAAIQRAVPKLTWAKYPRSITTVAQPVARQIRALIARRRKTGIPDYLDDAALDGANIDELRRIALLKARSATEARKTSVFYRARSAAIHRYVLLRSRGNCEGCGTRAPFQKADRSPYLEPHHITRLADDGPDHPAQVIALCPTCHRRAHYGIDGAVFNRSLRKQAARLEAKA